MLMKACMKFYYEMLCERSVMEINALQKVVWYFTNGAKDGG